MTYRAEPFWSFRFVVKLALLIALPAFHTSTAKGACAPESIDELKKIAMATRITINAEQKFRVGDKIKVSWQSGWDKPAQVPLYIVVTAPSAARFVLDPDHNYAAVISPEWKLKDLITGEVLPKEEPVEEDSQDRAETDEQ